MAMRVVQDIWEWPHCRNCGGPIGWSDDNGWFHLLNDSTWCHNDHAPKLGRESEMLAIPVDGREPPP